MPASPSSTCATVGSSKSSKPSKTKSRSKSKSPSTANSKNKSQKPQSSSVDQPDYSNQRIAGYVSDPIDPNPEYTYYTIEESVMSHQNDVAAFLDDFDTTMANLEG